MSPKALQALGVDPKRKAAPCHATYHYVFQAISADDLAKALGSLVNVKDGLGHVAIDGKRLRGSQHETSPGVHLLHAFSSKLQAAVGTLEVPPDSGECIEAIELIKSLPLDGAIVTGDAAFTMKPIVEAIRERGGDYFLFVKGVDMRYLELETIKLELRGFARPISLNARQQQIRLRPLAGWRLTSCNDPDLARRRAPGLEQLPREPRL